MKQTLFTLVSVLLLFTATAQKVEKYVRAKVLLNSTDHTLKQLAATGVAVDHGEYKKNTFFIADFSATEVAAMKQAGFSVEVLAKDATARYQNQIKKKEKEANKTTASIGCVPLNVPVPAHFRLGSYAGGHFTYSELLTILDSMRILYPGLISARAAIDTFHSIEGRPIYWVRISNHPDSYQVAKPQILYDAVHHAREPGSMTSLVYYMWYVLDHYSTDAHIRSIVDNAELYFIPCVNPDGYEYNISNNPSGGGLWRKNRRNNGSGSYGVDLNRNYGLFWGYDNVGSSPTATSEVYRGTAGFSEPETQAMKWFANNHHLLYSLNYHSYGNDIIYPWGYTGSTLTPDSSQFVACTGYMVYGTPYRFGTGDQTVGYVTNGDSDDWQYGEQTSKNKIFGQTPEIGLMDNGFYPPATEILPDCQNNLIINSHAADLLLPFATISSPDQKIITATNGFFHYALQRLGYRDTTYTVSVTSLDSRLTFTTTSSSHTGLPMLGIVTDSFGYSINPTTLNGQLLRYQRQLFNGFYNITDTVSFYYSNAFTNIAPSTNNMTDWISNGWDTCATTYFSAPASIGSSADGCSSYRDSVTATLQLAQPINLTRARKAYLYFYCKYGIEANYDFAAVYASPAGAGAWQPLCGRYTKQGGLNQGLLSAMYDGQQQNWVQEEMDLADYIGQSIDLQFAITADLAVNYSGFFIDNVNIIYVRDTNTAIESSATATAGIQLFPNPTAERLHITAPQASLAHPVSVVVYNQLGIAVLHLQCVQPFTEADITALATGSYYVKALDGGLPLPVQQLVVQR